MLLVAGAADLRNAPATGPAVPDSDDLLADNSRVTVSLAAGPQKPCSFHDTDGADGMHDGGRSSRSVLTCEFYNKPRNDSSL